MASHYPGRRADSFGRSDGWSAVPGCSGGGSLKIQALGSRNESHRTPPFCQAFFRAVHNLFALRAIASGKPRARRPLRLFSTSSPRPFQKRPMKPAYRASKMSRKTLTAGIQPGTSNVPTPGPPPRPSSLSETQLVSSTLSFCPIEQSSLAKSAALPSFDCSRVSLKKRTRTGDLAP